MTFCRKSVIFVTLAGAIMPALNPWCGDVCVRVCVCEGGREREASRQAAQGAGWSRRHGQCLGRGLQDGGWGRWEG